MHCFLSGVIEIFDRIKFLENIFHSKMSAPNSGNVYSIISRGGREGGRGRGGRGEGHGGRGSGQFTDTRGGRGSGPSHVQQPPTIQPPPLQSAPYGHLPSFLPGASSLIEQLDKRLLVVLRDGRHLIGVS